MLLGMGIAHLGSDNLSFNVIDDKTVNINQLNSRLYYSAGSMRTMQNPFGLKFDWVEGVGLGTDLGVMYEYRPNALKYKGFDWCESEKSLAYSWKFGMSITDLGFISYWGNSSNITSLGNQQWKINPNIIQNGQFTTVMMYAKHARGAMTRYLIENPLSDVEELKLYDVDGYQYNDLQSTADEWVFIR
jgi:hypothetical protein